MKTEIYSYLLLLAIILITSITIGEEVCTFFLTLSNFCTKAINTKKVLVMK